MIPTKIHEAILLVGVNSRDLVYSQYFDPDMSGTLHGLCHHTCMVVNALVPGEFTLHCLTFSPHFFLRDRRKRVWDVTDRSYFVPLYKRSVLRPFPSRLSRRARTLLARVNNFLETF